MEEKKEMVMEKEIIEIPVINFSVIVALVSAILAFIYGIINAIIGAATISAISSTLSSGASENATIIINQVASAISTTAAIYLIIVWPILTFIGVFITAAIAAILYNQLAPRVGGISIKLK